MDFQIDKVKPIIGADKKNASEKPDLEKDIHIDRLKLYFQEPIQVGEITVYQPSIQGIMSRGENNVYDVANMVAGNTTMYRLSLWRKGIDWNKISDFELFSILTKMMPIEKSEVLFGENLDFTKFQLILKNSMDDDSKELVMYNQEQDIEIDKKAYLELRAYVRAMFGIYPKVEKAKGKATKESMIEEDEMNERNAKNNKSDSSILLPMISACCNHPGFKYRPNELKDIGIYQFMDSVQRLQIYESTNALTHGMYSGMISVKDIDKEEFNFMREIKTKR